MKSAWEEVTLDSVCEIHNGGTPNTNIPSYWDGELLWITPKDLGKLTSKYVEETERKISSEGLRNSSAKMLPVNSLILSTRAPIGYLAINKKKISTNQGCKGLVPKKKLSAEYLYYYLLKSHKLLNEMGSGATFKELSTSKLSKLHIPLPPLTEQKRIVAILDKAFSAIEKAKENAQKNLQNAKELFESYLNSVFENPGDDWVEKSFENVCTLKRGYDLPTNSRINGSFPLVSSNGITDWINMSKVKAPGVVTGRSGTIGNVHFISQDFWPLNTSLYVKDFNGNSEKFIFYFLKQFKLDKYATGAGVPTLNRNNVHNIKVALPVSVLEQENIVKKLDRLLSDCEKMVLRYQMQLSCLDELKKSILQKAFNGELKTTSEIEI